MSGRKDVQVLHGIPDKKAWISRVMLLRGIHGHHQRTLGEDQGIMEDEKPLSTDDIRAKLEKGESAPDSQEWNDSSARKGQDTDRP